MNENCFGLVSRMIVPDLPSSGSTSATRFAARFFVDPDWDVHEDEDYLEVAYDGDLRQKSVLHDLIGRRNDKRFLRLITNEDQAAWLQQFLPSLLPPKNPNGTEPSPHRKATRFEYWFSVSPHFRRFYLATLNEGLWTYDDSRDSCSRSESELQCSSLATLDKLIAGCEVLEVVLYQGRVNQGRHQF